MTHALGEVHSTESFGAVDGPGVRFVVFMQGCPLKCLYCHNRDSWDIKDAKYYISADEMVNKILSYKNFIRSGGVTISGGEPLMQHQFCFEMIELLHEHNIHVAIDTSGFMPLDTVKYVLDACDMVLLDIKSYNDEMCKTITGSSNKNAIKTLEYLEQIKKPVWIRHVLLPQYTLADNLLTELAEFLSKFTCIEKVELLPFHKMGEYKWEQMGKKYQLSDIPAPTNEEIKHAKEIFIKKGLNV